MLHTPHIAPCYCYRCPFNLVPDRCGVECADELEKAILYEGPDSVSAFIAEPVVGATAGALVPKNGYFQRIREICDKYDVLLISDEVMSGVGRTGRNWALDHWGVVPDLIVASKGLASGYTPLYVVVAREEIHRVIKEKNGTSSTATRTARTRCPARSLGGVDYIEKHDLVAASAKKGAYLLEKLQGCESTPCGRCPRPRLFAGIEFVKDRKTKEPFDPKLRVTVLGGNSACAQGLISYPGGGGAAASGATTACWPPRSSSRRPRSTSWCRSWTRRSGRRRRRCEDNSWKKSSSPQPSPEAA
jgi:adenosylmethionine-8-amino-7-oxononanoate aminotransferase